VPQVSSTLESPRAQLIRGALGRAVAMNRLTRKLALALAVGLLLLGLIGIVSYLSHSARFYPLCALVGVALVGLALAAQVNMNGPSATWMPVGRQDHSGGDDVHAPIVSTSPGERASARLGSIYMALAALPCIAVAAVHYFA
jgi:hypothetical protein